MSSLRSRNAALILLILSFFRGAISAQEPEISQDLTQKEVDHVKPFAYSLSLMAVGFPALLGIGAFPEDPSFDTFSEAFKSSPVWDNDPAIYNLVLHPLWGSETYLRAREGNWGIAGSIGFSMGMSVTWEYLVESWAEHPSAQDLILTTGIGWVIGEGRYKIKQRASEHWDWAVDPINTTLDRFHVRLLRHGPEEVATVYALKWNF